MGSTPSKARQHSTPSWKKEVRPPQTPNPMLITPQAQAKIIDGTRGVNIGLGVRGGVLRFRTWVANLNFLIEKGSHRWTFGSERDRIDGLSNRNGIESMDFRIDRLSNRKGIATIGFRIGAGSNPWSFGSLDFCREVYAGALQQPRSWLLLEHAATYDCSRCVDTLTPPGQKNGNHCEFTGNRKIPERKPL